MEKETVQKIEETAVKLLDWIQEQVSDGVVCMEDSHPLPEMVNAVAKLIEALKGVGEKYGNAQSPEVVLPIESLQKLTRGAVLETKNMDEQRIREIVREELAAQKEQLTDAVKQSLHIDATDFLVATDGMLRGTSE
ncbi:hypothetical protein [Paenibacillus thiaminolyticus]|uniref:hypothetical protein n=1 Tax=Paenibacillus thiaminolyticus TaxID=49283 RepID=UPI0011644AC8|nr:hypothetical protein [Paenibacillus thiaminolyticus]